MSEEIEKAKIELQEAEEELEKLRIWPNANSLEQSGQCLNDEEVVKASEKVKLARIRHLTLEYTNRGWPQSRIKIRLKKLGLIP